MTPKIIAPTRYKHCIITPVQNRGGFDVFEAHGKWFHVKTQKQAKWWSSVYSRIQDEFAAHTPRSTPNPTDDHTPRSKA